MPRTIVHTENAPAAVGPYSQGVIANGFLYTAGQGGLIPGTAQLAGATIEAQTRQTLENIRAIVEAAGSSLAQVIKCNVYLQDMNDFAAMNAVYAEFFPNDPPARTTVEVARLPLDMRVEIEAIALI